LKKRKKITKKRADGVVQVQALNSSPSTTKEKKKKDFVLPLIKCKSGHNYFTNNHLNIPCSKGLI
jgi:hypothetical protein